MGIEASYRISGSRTKMFMKCYVSHTISLRYMPQIYTSQKQGPETSNRQQFEENRDDRASASDTDIGEEGEEGRVDRSLGLDSIQRSKETSFSYYTHRRFFFLTLTTFPNIFSRSRFSRQSLTRISLARYSDTEEHPSCMYVGQTWVAERIAKPGYMPNRCARSRRIRASGYRRRAR